MSTEFTIDTHDDQVTDMLKQLGWRSLAQRRADIRLTFFYKSIHGLIALDITKDLEHLQRTSRHTHPMAYNIPLETKKYIQQSFIPRTVVQWNSLPAAIAMAPNVDAFREGVCTINH